MDSPRLRVGTRKCWHVYRTRPLWNSPVVLIRVFFAPPIAPFYASPMPSPATRSPSVPPGTPATATCQPWQSACPRSCQLQSRRDGRLLPIRETACWVSAPSRPMRRWTRPDQRRQADHHRRKGASFFSSAESFAMNPRRPYRHVHSRAMQISEGATSQLDGPRKLVKGMGGRWTWCWRQARRRHHEHNAKDGTAKMVKQCRSR